MNNITTEKYYRENILSIKSSYKFCRNRELNELEAHRVTADEGEEKEEVEE